MNAYIENNPPINLFKYLLGMFRTGQEFADVICTSRGRDAIQLALDYLDLSDRDTILLPTLTCDTVTSVVLNNCKAAYYDLNRDYSIDIATLEQIIQTNESIKVVYVIHYFGFIHENIAQISALCKQYGVLLIEDHAHSALSKYQNTYADTQIFSFRKLLPTADGGGIRFNRTTVDHNFRFRDQMAANIKALLIAIKRIGSLYSATLRSRFGSLIQQDIDRLSSGSRRIDPLPVSTFGNSIIRSADIKEISEIRRRQYRWWQEIMGSTVFVSPFSHLPDEVVPYGFPVKLQNPREVIEHFKQYNIFLKMNWEILPAGTKETHPISHELAESSLTLPIYPGLHKKQMLFLRDEIVMHGVPLFESEKIGSKN
jgi:dTDP-4-amino-4,6-dideoxygalactose transaminase